MLKIYLKDRWSKILRRQKDYGICRYHMLDSIESLALDDVLTHKPDPDPEHDDRIRVKFGLDFPLGGCFVEDLRRENSDGAVVSSMPDAIVYPRPCAAVRNEDGHWEIASCVKEQDENLILITFRHYMTNPNRQVSFFSSDEGFSANGNSTGRAEILASLIDERGLRGVLLRGPSSSANVCWTTPRDKTVFSCQSRPDDDDFKAAERVQAELTESTKHYLRIQHKKSFDNSQDSRLFREIEKDMEELKIFGYSLFTDEKCWYLTDPDGFCQRFFFTTDGLETGVDVVGDLLTHCRRDLDRYARAIDDDAFFEVGRLQEELQQETVEACYQAHQQGLPEKIAIARQAKGNFRSHGWVIRPDGTLRLPDSSVVNGNNDILQNSGLANSILPLYGVKYIDYWAQILPGELVLEVALPAPITTYDDFVESDFGVKWAVIYCEEGNITALQYDTVRELKKYVKGELFANLQAFDGASLYLYDDLNRGWDIPGYSGLI